ncbi:hypothetical protein [Massilia sp. DWR3-1-1]|uniref:hypothetical protein n=1 Tax=Massilia sp. DWR3-1-1 TaxID=2804559 RepID=UPI003CF45C6E
MEFPLTEIFDAKGGLVNVKLVVPEADSVDPVFVNFKPVTGTGGSYSLASVIEFAATYGHGAFFVIHDGFDGKANTYVSTTWIKDIAAAAMSALPRLMGTLVLTVSFVPNDPKCPF